MAVKEVFIEKLESGRYVLMTFDETFVYPRRISEEEIEVWADCMRIAFIHGWRVTNARQFMEVK